MNDIEKLIRITKFGCKLCKKQGQFIIFNTEKKFLNNKKTKWSFLKVIICLQCNKIEIIKKTTVTLSNVMKKGYKKLNINNIPYQYIKNVSKELDIDEILLNRVRK
jgi:hypothetical protein